MIYRAAGWRLITKTSEGRFTMNKISDKFENVWGSIAFCALVVVLIWAYLKVTPSQMSAECEFASAQTEGGVR